MKKTLSSIISVCIAAGSLLSCDKANDDSLQPYMAHLYAANSSSNDHFGYATSFDGTTVALGAPDEASTTCSVINGSDYGAANNFGNSNGAVYLYKYPDTPMAYLKAPNTSDNDYFGQAVSVDGDLVAVGAPGEDSSVLTTIEDGDFSPDTNGRADSGAVYVFAKTTDDTWSHQVYLKAPNASNNDRFGYSLALSGSRVVAGAPGEDSDTTSIVSGADLAVTNDAGSNTGAVYVFERAAAPDANGRYWAHQAYLKATNATNEDRFGWSVAMSGTTIVVGAPGEDGSVNAIINGADLTATDDAARDSGAVYVFVNSGSGWVQQAYLKAPNGLPGDEFGHAVAINGDTLVVGARYENSDTLSIINGADLSAANTAGYHNGAAYVFRRGVDGAWAFLSYLKAPNGSADDRFGSSVAISSGKIAIGAPGEDSSAAKQNNLGVNTGAVYLFNYADTCKFQSYVKSSTISENDNFGWSVSMYLSTLVVGSPYENRCSSAGGCSEVDNGSAHIYDYF